MREVARELVLYFQVYRILDCYFSYCLLISFYSSYLKYLKILLLFYIHTQVTKETLFFSFIFDSIHKSNSYFLVVLSMFKSACYQGKGRAVYVVALKRLKSSMELDYDQLGLIRTSFRMEKPNYYCFLQERELYSENQERKIFLMNSHRFFEKCQYCCYHSFHPF